MLKIHDEDEENADYGRVRMYQALKYRKEVGKLDGIKIPCEAIVRSVMKQINLIHRGEPHKSTPKYYLLHILRKQNVSFLRKPFVKELVKDVNLPVLVLAFGTITNHDVLDKLQTSLTGKL